ncbi:MAG: hypothetical protein WCJ26_15725, partial [bacterium]
YEWQTNASGGYVTIAGATSSTYQGPSLTSTTSYQRRTVSIQNGVTCYSGYTSAVTITVQSTVTAGAIATDQTICYGGDPAAFTSTAGTGSGTISYRWESTVSPFTTWNIISGATLATYDAPSGLTATTEYRRITISTVDGVACFSNPASYVTVTIPSALSATTNKIDVLCHGNATGTATANPAGGSAPYTYRWNSSPQQTTQTATGLVAGTYIVTVTDAHSCTTTATATITEPAILNASITAQTNVTTYLGSDGSATVTASGGTPGYTYLWNIGQTSASATGLSEGTYTVTVTDANSCTATATAVITQPGQVCLLAKVLLQGPYEVSTHLMRDDLRAQGFIPSKEPYSSSPYIPAFTHVGGGGGETVTNPAVFTVTGPNAIVDWVFIELRDKTNKSLVKYTRSALVQRDGDVVDVDGVSPVCFQGLSDNQFYVAVRHRNHLGVMTASAKTMTTSGTVVDFRDGSEPEFNYGTTHPVAGSSYNYSGLSQSTPESGKRALWYGDANSDHKVKYEAPGDDQSIILSDVASIAGNISTQSGYDFCLQYYAGDVDLSGKVKYEAPHDDRSLVLYQILFYPLNTSKQSIFDFMYEQLP